MAFLIGGANSAADTGYDVANSCRFEDGDSAYLSRSIGSGNQKTFTFSAWVKRGNLGTEQHLFGQREDDNNRTNIFFTSGDLLNIRSNSSGAGLHVNVITTQVFRDVSAWYHIVVAVDTEDGTAANRVKTYVNGTQVTSFGTETYPAEDATLVINNAVSHEVGSYDTSAGYFDGYMAEVVWIDGTQYAASNFGEFNADSPAIWQPTDVSGLTFGTNGFYLDFEASGNLGNDANGGTDWGETNLAATNQTTDTPTNNFCTLNPLDNVSFALSEGNLRGTAAASSWHVIRSTISISPGAWYFELYSKVGTGNGNTNIGITRVEDATVAASAAVASTAWSYSSNGNIYNNNGIDTDTGATWSAGDIISISFTGSVIKFYKNNSLEHTESSLTGDYMITVNGYDDNDFIMNFGQDGTFNGNKTAGGNADANGHGDFFYAPPTGFYALNTKNLAEFG